ncbi:MAG: sensor histidine kinase [Lachnospiraceae bacterium]
MNYLIEYIKKHRHVLEYLMVCAFFYWMLNFLQPVGKRDTLYGLLIFSAIGLVFGGYGFFRYRNRKKKLEEMMMDPVLYLDEMEEPANALEEAYQICLREMEKQNGMLVSAQDQKYTDMLEYYTLWAHQIKTPIAGMRLIFQGMQEKTEEMIELEQGLFSIEQYVEMVLSYLRLGSTSKDFVFEHVELEDVVKKAVHKYARSFIRRHIALRMDVPQKIVLTDEKWLTFVIEQILSNALKYTKRGSVSISLEEPQILVIADTGIGIASEDLPRIFEKGYTGYNGRSDRKSTGIGLYLCKKIMEQMGHEITITSELSKGTSVRLHLNSHSIQGE